MTQKHYEVNLDIFLKILTKKKNNTAPGIDLIVTYWWKKLFCLHGPLVGIFEKMFKNEVEIPQWAPLVRTTLLAKNKNKHEAKNYRPIACENIMFKLYTGMLASFVTEHCIDNDIITPEQAGGKKGSSGFAEQLLINKMATEECKNYRRNLICIWLDYKKAFDSVPRDWIIKALHLAKGLENVINAIEQLMNVWATRVSLKTENGQIETDFIEFLSGILQGDQLSLIQFILSANPLSFLLSKSDGYMMGNPNKRTTKLTHLFFLDDLKMYSENMNQAKQQLDIVTSFSKDIGMQFGLEKCAYVYIERGKRKQLGENITVNNIAIEELKQDDTYKYLGQDEAVTYNGPLNKE